MKTIVVTGGNRGIGKEIVKQLSSQGHQVILTARDKQKGLEVQKEFAEQGLDVSFEQLDVSSYDSIDKFVSSISSQYEKIDVLINNAGLFIDGNKNTYNIDLDNLEQTMRTNVYGPIALTKGLISLLEKSNDPRIINISSGMGAIDDIAGGYPSYRISKTALNSFTINLSKELSNFKINAVCPGWVRTDMGGSSATRPVEKGAETPVWLALDNSVTTGKFWRDKQVIPW